MSNYVNNAIAALGAHIFSSGTASNNVSATRTNTFQGWVGNQTAITTNTVLNADLVVNNYIRHVVSTQLFLGIGGPTISVQAYVWRDGAGTVSIHPEIYQSSGTAPIEHGTAATQVITAITPTLYTWFIPVTSTNFALATNILWAWKHDVAKPATANLYFASGGIYPSHTEVVQSPGNITIDASQVVSGTIPANVMLSGTYESNTLSVSFDLSKPRQYYSTNDNIKLSGLTGLLSGSGEREASLTIKNTKAGDITLEIPNQWHTPDGLRAYTITNGQHGELSVKAWFGAGTGILTNAAMRMLR
jgi:hypothetical protein